MGTSASPFPSVLAMQPQLSSFHNWGGSSPFAMLSCAAQHKTCYLLYPISSVGELYQLGNHLKNF